MDRRIGLAGVVLALLGLAGCIDDSDAGGGGGLEVQSLHKGDATVSPIPSARALQVFNSEYDYEVTLSSYSPDDPATVDFTQGQVVLVDYGMTPNLTGEIKVKSVKNSGDEATVNVKIVKPGSGCGGSTAIGRPFEFVYIATTKKLTFNESSTVKDC